MRFFVALLLLALLASACSSEASLPSDSIPAELPFAADDEPLRVAMVQPETTAPADVVLSNQAEVILSDLLYDGLTEVDGQTGRLRPGVAESWKANEDFTEWVFDLDTERVSVDDVVDSFDKVSEQGAPAIRSALAVLERVEPEGEDRVRFTLARPQASFAWTLAGPALAIDPTGEAQSGLMSVVSSDESGMTLRPTSGLSEINIRWSASEAEALQLFESGEVDLAVAETELTESSRVELLGHTRFLSFNTASPALQDPQLRSLIRSLVDADEIMQRDDLLPVDGLSSPALAGSESQSCATSCETVEADTSEIADGVVLTLGVSNEADADAAARIQKALAVANVSIEIVEESPQVLATRLADGELDILMFGWIAGSASIDGSIPPLLRSGSPANSFQLGNPDVDALLAQAERTGEDQLRWDLISKAEELALADDIAVPLGAFRSRVVKNEKAQSLIVRSDGTLDVSRF